MPVENKTICKLIGFFILFLYSSLDIIDNFSYDRRWNIRPKRILNCFTHFIFIVMTTIA